eukprot:jgi/Botrbrau1/16277/Bobra.0066s0057.2
MFVSRGSTTSYSIKSCVKAQRQQKLKSERLLGQSAECQRLLRKAVKSRRPSTLHAMLIGQVKQSRSRSVKCWGSFTYDKGDILLSVADSLQSKMDGLQSQDIAAAIFAVSGLPYIGFLYYLQKSEQANKVMLVGWYWLFIFIALSVPAANYVLGVRDKIREAEAVSRQAASTSSSNQLNSSEPQLDPP